MAATFTNKPPAVPSAATALRNRVSAEVQLDKIAEKLKIDPADLRPVVESSNAVRQISFVSEPSILLSAFVASSKCPTGKMIYKLPEGHGVGLACSAYLTGAGLPIYWNKMPHSGVQLKFDRSGGVSIFCGATEIGQGSDDVLAGIVAEVLGIDTFDIRLFTGDTDLGPVDLGSYSSRVTLMAGNAALQAAERGKAIIAEAVAEKLELPKERLRLLINAFSIPLRQKGFTFQEAVCLAEAASAPSAQWAPTLRQSLPLCTKAAALDRLQPIHIPPPLLKSK
jgi:CO/xanthine dehydrogenase Mo-binding subunit